MSILRSEPPDECLSSRFLRQSCSKLHQCARWPPRHALPQVGNLTLVTHDPGDVQMCPVGGRHKLSQEGSRRACTARTGRANHTHTLGRTTTTMALNVRTYCTSYLVIVPVLSYVASYLIIAIYVEYGEWVNLAIVGAWHFYDHPYCTDSDILFHFLTTNVIVSRFG